MSRETSKSFLTRFERGDFEHYLRGNGIDIGCGKDPLTVISGSVREWDRKDGDAQSMEGAADASYDFVYSSHTLEHMRDVREALSNWVRILRPGGILYFTVPDFTLYEKGCWPSLFNPDHKASFSVAWLANSAAQERSTHFAMTNLVRWLDLELGVSFLELRLEHAGFDPSRFQEDQTEEANGWAQSQICLIGQKR